MIIQEQINLKHHHTFRIDVTADYFLEANHFNDIIESIEYCKAKKIPYLIIGQGSNVLFTKAFKGLIIKNKLQGINIINENQNEIVVEVAAGVLWDDWVAYAVKKNWQGIENLSGIPGNVGAAPIQNIGAYGVEVKSVILRVNYYDTETKKNVVIKTSDAKFNYRSSIFKTEFKNKAIITSVVFELKKNNFQLALFYNELAKHFGNNKNISLEEIRTFIIQIRKQKLPDYNVFGNAGSFLKNPIISKIHFTKLQNQFSDIPFYEENELQIKIPAAWLIEKCNWKGKVQGQVSTYENQPLVIMNLGNATGEAVLSYANEIVESVWKKFDIKLEREINVYE